MGEEAFHFAKTTHLQFNRKAEFRTIPTFKPIFSVGRYLDTFPREIDPSESCFGKRYLDGMILVVSQDFLKLNYHKSF